MLASFLYAENLFSHFFDINLSKNHIHSPIDSKLSLSLISGSLYFICLTCKLEFVRLFPGFIA